VGCNQQFWAQGPNKQQEKKIKKIENGKNAATRV
jgi:hypothetical protein